MKNQDSPTGYMIAQCTLIAENPLETPARRKLARKWLDRLMQENDCWEGGGQTKAEAAGIEVPANAPGGAKLSPGGGASGRKVTSPVPYEGGELSSEVSSGYRSGRWAAEKSNY